LQAQKVIKFGHYGKPGKTCLKLRQVNVMLDYPIAGDPDATELGNLWLNRFPSIQDNLNQRFPGFFGRGYFA